jgi:hypothetical protein
MAKRILIAFGLALCTLLLDGATKPPAECAYCSRRACLNSNNCYRGCVCMKQGRERRGTCVSFDAVPR